MATPSPFYFIVIFSALFSLISTLSIFPAFYFIFYRNIFSFVLSQSFLFERREDCDIIEGEDIAIKYKESIINQIKKRKDQYSMCMIYVCFII